MALAGRALAAPDEIRWGWVAGADGPAMLMRRYVLLDAGRVACVVDVGRSGWRFLTAADGDIAPLRRGVLAWSAEQAAIAGYNPAQPRWGKGGPQVDASARAVELPCEHR